MPETPLQVLQRLGYEIIERSITGTRPERTVKWSGNVIGSIIFDPIRRQYAFSLSAADTTFVSEARTAFLRYMNGLPK